MSSTLAAVDHVVLLCKHLDHAEDAFARLGFCVSPRGRHGSSLGTANSTVVMPDQSTYVELLGISEPTKRNQSRREKLDALGTHIYGIALKGSARNASKLLSRLGVLDEVVENFSRKIATPTGVSIARFSVARTLPNAFPGAWVFVCEHHTPELVWQSEYLDHPNGSLSLDSVCGVAGEFDTLEQTWARLFDGQVSCENDRFTIPTSTATVQFLKPAAFKDAYKQHDPGIGSAALLNCMQIRVRSIRALKNFLEGTEFSLVPIGGAKYLVPDCYGLGTHLVFFE